MIIIPMAGRSQRFIDAGYTKPKYMLDLHGKSVFAHAILSFKKYFATEEFLFIGLDHKALRDFVCDEVEKLGVVQWSLVCLPDPTLGQADTVAKGLAKRAGGGDNAITIFNIDTFRPNFTFPQSRWFDNSSGYVEVMASDNPGFSYVLPDNRFTDNRIRETAEKRIISNLASTGLYHFGAASLFYRAFEIELVRPQASELYVAPLYNHLIGLGLQTHFEVVDASAVVFCGTPSQYEALRDRPHEE